MKILIIGGAGFIGSHLTDKLIKCEHEVRIIDNFSKGNRDLIETWINPKAELFEMDASDLGSEQLDDIDEIIICLESKSNKVEQLAKNDLGIIIKLFEVIRDLGVQSQFRKIILISSNSVYGEGSYYCTNCKKIVFPKRESRKLKVKCPKIGCDGQVNIYNTSEQKPCVPTSVRGIIDKAKEDLLLSLVGDLLIPVVILRVWNAYGSRQFETDGVVGEFISETCKKKAPVLYEDGRQVRDFVHVHDIAEAVRLAVEKDEMNDDIFNVGMGNKQTISFMAKIVSENLGGKNPYISKRFRWADVRHLACDIRKIRRFGYVPKVGFSGGLKEVKLYLQRIGKI